MVNTLQFNMSVPTAYVFVKRFLKAAQADRKVSISHISAKYFHVLSFQACTNLFTLFLTMKQLELLAFFLVELSLVEYEMLKYPPSLLAAAAVYTAQCSIYGFKQWSKTCEWHSNYSEDQLL